MKPVIWSDDARRDYLDILGYIAQDNPDAAERIVDAIEQTGNGLGEFATGRPGRVSGTYEKLVPRLPFILAYTIAFQGGHEVVAILRVIHTARDWREEDWPA
ncbi:type II toxin-antitoxin system RelE/ParE family toxin [Bosea sp. F3-2]|uniref:type II toxin-antitoxin system RelE/ParE family toxin n=1 Tax=Bosea sp. F3-2 TaxID=2599640 RepID=UPI0011EE02D7|nr:type II toxin-antitoxin system RelE/ParE family toxin [Bosea sp. F3-2]QEL24587.1 type II toxin-antitoxin system RelE/ParE family toxin [Bosea sp. F3-2]